MMQRVHAGKQRIQKINNLNSGLFMHQILSPKQLSLTIKAAELGFADTSQLTGEANHWVGQSSAEQAARFGLELEQPGFHLVVLGQPGTGRTSMMLNAVRQAAARRAPATDLVYVNNFEAPEKPVPLSLQPGTGAVLRNALEQFIRQLARSMHGLLGASLPDASQIDSTGDKDAAEAAKAAVAAFLDSQLTLLKETLSGSIRETGSWTTYLAALEQDVLENLEVFQLNPAESEGTLENFLSRYRANLLVDNRGLQGAPVIYDDDPSQQSLFGVMEGTSDSSNIADFLRLRAGNVLRASGGMLMLHLRDILADQQNGSQILEKLHRFLRNGHVQIEESAISAPGHSLASHLAPDALPAHVKIILIASREDYYHLQEDSPELASYFRIKVEFAETFTATPTAYQAVSAYVASRCEHFQLRHFTNTAVIRLLRAMHRWADDQARLSADFAKLQTLILESAAMAGLRQAGLVESEDVEKAIVARQARHQYVECQLSDSIADGELMVSVQGNVVGQINGLTHTELGDASFGSPVRITARCYAGDKGVINIDREVEMSGPNHDKGVFILQSWLSASFSRLTPLALNASLVFEQEYHGVEGDSASCAELYALLSALSGLPLRQGIAVTGALNQHGEVMPIGGINEKIEGYFKVCQKVGLDGKQGVLLPSRNLRHLALNDEVIAAVDQGRFHLFAIDHVLQGMSLLTDIAAGEATTDGNYPDETVMGRAQQTLELFRTSYKKNHQAVPTRA